MLPPHGSRCVHQCRTVGAGVMNEQNTSVFSPGLSQSFTMASIRVCMCPSAFIFFLSWSFLPSGHSESLLCVSGYDWSFRPDARASELHPLLWGNRTPQAAANRTNLLGLTGYGTDSCLYQHTFSSSPLMCWQEETLFLSIWEWCWRNVTDRPSGVNEMTTGVHVMNQLKRLLHRPQSRASSVLVTNTESCGERIPGGRALKAPRFVHRVERTTPKFKGMQLPQRTQMARDHTWTWQGTATSNSPLIPSLWWLLLLCGSEELS